MVDLMEYMLQPEEEALDQAENQALRLFNLRNHLLVFIAANCAFVAVWLAYAVSYGGGAWFPWFLFPLAAWSVVMAIHAWNVYVPVEAPGEDVLHPHTRGFGRDVG
jgi:hypothetical protein